MPPDTSIRRALIQRFSFDSSAAISGPMSLGTPVRPSVVSEVTIAFTAGLSRIAWAAASDAVAPGKSQTCGAEAANDEPRRRPRA